MTTTTITPTAEVLTAARAWARAWRRANAVGIPEAAIGERMKALALAEAELVKAVRRLEGRENRSMSETASNP